MAQSLVKGLARKGGKRKGMGKDIKWVEIKGREQEGPLEEQAHLEVILEDPELKTSELRSVDSGPDGPTAVEAGPRLRG